MGNQPRDIFNDDPLIGGTSLLAAITLIADKDRAQSRVRIRPPPET